MRTSTFALALAVSLAAAHSVSAQRAPESPSAQTQPAIAVSDAELETFASIYADLLDTAAKFDAEMQAATTEDQAREVRAKVQDESIGKVAKRGWTPEKFNSVSEAIKGDPQLTERAVALIEAK